MTEEKITGAEVSAVDWVDRNVRLDGDRYRAEATPYLRDLLQGLADAPVTRVSIRMPSQVGWTSEAVRARAEQDLWAWLRDGEPA